MIRIVTGCNERYFRKMDRWLDSLENQSNVPFTLIKVGWEQESGRKGEELVLRHKENYGAPDTTECIQHGSFLKVIDGHNDELLMYCDGDMVMQRPFTEAELAWLNSFWADTFSAGWNQPDESLIDCTRLIMPKVEMDEIWERFPGKLDKWPSLNVGVLVMRRSAWEKVYAAYMERWELACDTFEHQARQQWLICFTLFALELDFRLMPYTMHVHGHFGIKPGMDVDSAVFRHAI